MENIFENIEAIRHKKELKQEVIAKELGVTQSAYSNYINRNEDIPLGRLSRIANILDVDVIDIIKWPVKYVPEEENCNSCCEKDKIIENLNMLLDEYKKKKGKL
jgi:transcriptional regulator with XRE-family HTH domain